MEKALQSGQIVLMQDPEYYDEILNGLLDRECRNGHAVFRRDNFKLSKFSKFKIIFYTQNRSISFPPNICSRVSFVNFTVTRSSLQSQFLIPVLKAERPEAYEKRSDIVSKQRKLNICIFLINHFL